MLRVHWRKGVSQRAAGCFSVVQLCVWCGVLDMLLSLSAVHTCELQQLTRSVLPAFRAKAELF
jgi:hypothetical protein